jgi:hypothetical protein
LITVLYPSVCGPPWPASTDDESSDTSTWPRLCCRVVIMLAATTMMIPAHSWVVLAQDDQAGQGGQHRVQPSA